MKLREKVAIVTGGAGGIGLAICERYATEGARVIIADIDETAARNRAESLGGSAMGLHLDVTDERSVKDLVDAVIGEFGGIDVLVNNAGIFDMAPVLDLTRECYRRVFSVNVEGLFFTLQAVARTMAAAGTGGKIINLASQAGRRGSALNAVYGASKAAVISLTQSAGLALVKRGINVNAISPGVVDTPMWDRLDALYARHEGRPLGEKKRLVGEAVPYGRMGRPKDLVGAAVFLASDDADYIVGQTLNVDGGNWLS